jgi:aerobic-type carbon monoxide dehydrogenase small subunit (CoxS/CutS family)
VRTPMSVEADRPLLFVLRNELDYTGAKYGCGEGQCGACTVLIDGVARRSCVTAVGSVAGKEITTIEGLADGEKLHPVQEAFLACDAMQCGYCTSGMILSSVALLRRNSSPGEAQIKEALEGNVCRCGAYNRILAAVQRAGKVMLSAAKESQRA